MTLADDGGETRALVEERGRRYEEVQGDLTLPGVPRGVVEGCLAAYGGIDVLVNSAGRSIIAPVETFGREQWDPMVALNLTAAFELAHEAARPMVAQGHGKIVNVASLFSFLGGRESPAYAATKHGIAGFTKAYCDELAAKNIQVNALAPGYVATAMTAARRADPAAEAAVRASTGRPLGRPGRPDGRPGLPVQPGVGLRQRPRADRRRRLSRPLTPAPSHRPQPDPSPPIPATDPTQEHL